MTQKAFYKLVYNIAKQAPCLSYVSVEINTILHRPEHGQTDPIVKYRACLQFTSGKEKIVAKEADSPQLVADSLRHWMEVNNQIPVTRVKTVTRNLR